MSMMPGWIPGCERAGLSSSPLSSTAPDKRAEGHWDKSSPFYKISNMAATRIAPPFTHTASESTSPLTPAERAKLAPTTAAAKKSSPWLLIGGIVVVVLAVRYLRKGKR